MALTEEELQAHAYITLRSGEKFSYANPGPFRLDDIAESLAKTARFRGHTRGFYSVAEHSCLVATLAARDGHPEIVKRACLLHDAHEAYTGDVPSPLKWACPAFKEIEKKIEHALRLALCPEIPPGVFEIVKRYDLEALYLEAEQLFEPVPAWAKPHRPYPFQRPLGSEWQVARAGFIQFARALGFKVE